MPHNSGRVWAPTEEQWQTLEKPEKDAFRSLVADRLRSLQGAAVYGGAVLCIGLLAVVCPLSIRGALLSRAPWMVLVGLAFLFVAYCLLRRCFVTSLTEEETKVLDYLRFTSELRVAELHRKHEAGEREWQASDPQAKDARKVASRQANGPKPPPAYTIGDGVQEGPRRLARSSSPLSQLPERLRQARTAFMKGQLTAAEFDQRHARLREEAEGLVAAACGHGPAITPPGPQAAGTLPGNPEDDPCVVLGQLREQFLEGHLSEDDLLCLSRELQLAAGSRGARSPRV
jgi:hypothetical protein